MKKINCKSCGSNTITSLYEKDETDGVCLCQNCGLIFTITGLEIREIEQAYNLSYYQKWDREFDSRINMWANRFKRLSLYAKPGKLLDIGCGLGEFAILAKKNGWDASVTEISKHAIDTLKDNNGIKAYHGDINKLNLENKQFDAITMWHVLEHMDNPKESLIKVHNLLKDSGLLIIEVPNADYLVQLIKNLLKTKNKFSSFVISSGQEPHLIHFSLKSLAYLLKNTGFKIKKVHVGIYGEHQNGIIRKLKSKIFNFITIVTYLITRKNIGVTTMLYAVKNN